MRSKGNSSAVLGDNAIDEAVMGLLLGDPPGLWAVEEIEREIGNHVHAKDSLSRLSRVGLIHRLDGLDGFVLASRAAIHFDSLGCE
jgi:hypothetical protein